MSELLCVIAIVAALAAILMPALVKAKQAARVTSAMENLHHLHVATKLYQMDYDGDGKYGYASEMGLVDNLTLYNQISDPALLLPGSTGLWLSPCGVHPDEPYSKEARVNLTYYASNISDEPLRHYSIEHQEDSMLYVDHNCADHSLDLYSPFTRKKFLGVRLSGQVHQRSTNEAIDLSVWH